MQKNERSWAIEVISYIKNKVSTNQFRFEDATGEDSLRIASGKTNFPDVILYTDKISGVIFNGWELKLPDTEVDDVTMLENATEKAKALQSTSFVTWNAKQAVIWGVNSYDYSVDALSILARSEAIRSINKREDITNVENYMQNVEDLEKTIDWILVNLNNLYISGRIKPAINVSSYYIDAILKSASSIIPNLEKDIKQRNSSDREFKNEFKKWKILEKQTLNILKNSSRKFNNVSNEKVLARFTYYKIIGKILFYLSLSENLSNILSPIHIDTPENCYEKVLEYFNSAKNIDYQAVFNQDFTDRIQFNDTANNALYDLISSLNALSFRLLPSEVIGNILENLVPVSERQKFGQYFTPPKLALLVTMSAIEGDMDFVIDPTSGTGTFLSIAYDYFKHSIVGSTHSELLEKVWGNDISHFPSVLSVINLYKQDPTETDNFPRVLRQNFMNLMPNQNVQLPNPTNYQEKLSEPLPEFDAIIGNFPFIQQEDVPSKSLNTDFQKIFRGEQQSLLNKKGIVDIPKRSDYFIYCFYQSYIHLKEEGRISAITSNAWLGKEYAQSFKKFLLDNFHIKYVVQSGVEHWFTDAQVSTIFITLEKSSSNNSTFSTKFVTIESTIENLVTDLSASTYEKIEDFYQEIDMCADGLEEWRQIEGNIYKKEGLTVVDVEKSVLFEAWSKEDNWKQFFVSTKEIQTYRDFCLASPNQYVSGRRGGKTECNDMFILKKEVAEEHKIENEFLVPLLKSPGQIKDYESDASIIGHYQFVCDIPEEVLEKDYPYAYKWIKRFEDKQNKNASKTIKEACFSYKPYWYSFKPKYANIVTAINPEQRLFYCYFPNKIAIDQRFIAIDILDDSRKDLIGCLYNFTYTLYVMELQGVARYLGALDLNSNIIKNMPILDPSSPNDIEMQEILDSYQKIKNREVLPILEEIRREDRKLFDLTICRIYGISDDLIEDVYGKLTMFVTERLKNKQNMVRLEG